MSDEKWSESGGGVNSMRYGVMAVLAGGLVGGAVLGLLSDKPAIGELLGGYKVLLQSNWQLLLISGVLVGVVNLMLSFKKYG